MNNVKPLLQPPRPVLYACLFTLYLFVLKLSFADDNVLDATFVSVAFFVSREGFVQLLKFSADVRVTNATRRNVEGHVARGNFAT